MNTENDDKDALTSVNVKRLNLLSLATTYGSIANLNDRLGRRRNDPYLYSVANGHLNTNGTPRTLGPKLCTAIEKAFNLPTGWMNTAHDPLLIDDTASAADTPQTQTPLPAPATILQPTPEQCANCISIPLLACAKRTNKTCIYLEREDISQHFPDHPLENLRAVVIHSGDLSPEFVPGDRVLIDIADTVPDAGVFAVAVNQRTLMRRIGVDLVGGLYIYADKYANQTVPFDSLEHKIIGRAIYHWRGRRL